MGDKRRYFIATALINDGVSGAEFFQYCIVLSQSRKACAEQGGVLCKFMYMAAVHARAAEALVNKLGHNCLQCSDNFICIAEDADSISEYHGDRRVIKLRNDSYIARAKCCAIVVQKAVQSDFVGHG